MLNTLNFKENQRIEKKRLRSPAKETYHYCTCQRLSKKHWNELVKRYGLQGDEIRDGNMLIAYRRMREMSECDRVYAEGRG